jgi:hypothetical protein
MEGEGGKVEQLRKRGSLAGMRTMGFHVPESLMMPFHQNEPVGLISCRAIFTVVPDKFDQGEIELVVEFMNEFEQRSFILD